MVRSAVCSTIRDMPTHKATRSGVILPITTATAVCGHREGLTCNQQLYSCLHAQSTTHSSKNRASTNGSPDLAAVSCLTSVRAELPRKLSQRKRNWSTSIFCVFFSAAGSSQLSPKIHATTPRCATTSEDYSRTIQGLVRRLGGCQREKTGGAGMTHFCDDTMSTHEFYHAHRANSLRQAQLALFRTPVGVINSDRL